MKRHLAIIGAAGLLAACVRGAAAPGEAQAEASAPAPAEAAAAPEKARPAIRTAKVGAGLDISVLQPRALKAGEPGLVVVTIRERYDAGALRISARASDGLKLSPDAPAAQFALAGADAHQWDLYASADSDGVYYLDLVATIEEAGGAVAGAARSFTVTVGAGAARKAAPETPDGKRPQMRGAAAPAGERATDEAIIVLPADETIRP